MGSQSNVLEEIECKPREDKRTKCKLQRVRGKCDQWAFKHRLWRQTQEIHVNYRILN